MLDHRERQAPTGRVLTSDRQVGPVGLQFTTTALRMVYEVDKGTETAQTASHKISSGQEV